MQDQNIEKVIPPFEEVAESILKIAEAMKAIERTRLSRETIVTLIYSESKVPKRDIRLVLSNLNSFDRLWLKPALAVMPKEKK